MELLEVVRRAPAAAQDGWLEDARSDRTLCRSALPDLVAAWAGHLDRLGLPAGARVGLVGHAPLDVAAAWLGVVASGRVVCPVAPDLPQERRAAWEQEVGPQAVLDAADAPDGAAGTPVPGGGLLLTSSGTTGRPKLVALRADQLLHTAGSVVAVHRLTADDRGFSPLPLHHINAEVVGLLATLLSGGTLVLDDRFHRTGFWPLLVERDVTWLNAVPAVLAILAREQPPDRLPPRLRFVRSASAPLALSVREAFVRATGLPVVETYGMTEAGSQITADDLDAQHPGSVGRPVGVELRLSQDGVVQVRGPGVVTSYAGTAGADSFTADGWLDTGDLGHLVDGVLHLDGRVDDVINRGGEKVFPHTVEDVLLADPEVVAAAVVARPDDVLGSVPVAAITTTGDPTAVVARLRDACARQLDRARRPVDVVVLASLPGGVNGKVSRKAVRALLEEQQEART